MKLPHPAAAAAAANDDNDADKKHAVLAASKPVSNPFNSLACLAVTEAGDHNIFTLCTARGQRICLHTKARLLAQ